jgi:hypothetical protein
MGTHVGQKGDLTKRGFGKGEGDAHDILVDTLIVWIRFGLGDSGNR